MSRPDARRYARVHHDLEDKLPPAVYASGDLLAAWLKLFLAADSVWPAVAERPHAVDEDAFVKLADAGVLTIDPAKPYRYRMRRLDGERLAAHTAARESYSHRKDRPALPASEVRKDTDAFYARCTTEGTTVHTTEGTTACTTDGTARDVGPVSFAPDGTTPTLSDRPPTTTEARETLAKVMASIGKQHTR